jgi:hypothetical protein
LVALGKNRIGQGGLRILEAAMLQCTNDYGSIFGSVPNAGDGVLPNTPEGALANPDTDDL